MGSTRGGRALTGADAVVAGARDLLDALALVAGSALAAVVHEESGSGHWLDRPAVNLQIGFVRTPQIAAN